MKYLIRYIIRRIAIVFIVITLLCGSISALTSQVNQEKKTDIDSLNNEKQVNSCDYTAYLKYYPGIKCADKSIELFAQDAINISNVNKSIIDDKTIVELSEDQSLSFELESIKSQFYYVDISYYTRQGRGVDYLLSFKIDGETPFVEADNLSLNRLWGDSFDNSSGEKFDVDSSGDEIIPSQKELDGWQTTGFFSANIYSDKDIKIYLSKGKHTISLKSKREKLLLEKIILHGENSLPSYSKYKKDNSLNQIDNKGIKKKIELEHSDLKSSNGISPYYDRSTPAVSPSSSQNIRVNVIGGYSWRRLGDWLAWELDIPKDGWYAFTFHYQQVEKRGLPSVRSISIDGDVPFKEFENIEFNFCNDWKQKTLSDDKGEPYLIYLKKGKHDLKMTVKSGKYEKVLNELSHSIDSLNNIYRNIIMITGSNPDSNRDYYIDTEIPSLINDLKTVRSQLIAESNMFNDMGKDGGSKATYIKVLISQLNEFISDARIIPKALTIYQSNITALADILNEMQQQPLALDYLWVTSENMSVPDSKVSFLKHLEFRANLFITSFLKDYSKEGNNKDQKSIKIWVSQNDVATTGIAIGRDQAKLLQKMVSSEFTKKTNITANISLVNSSASLVQSILSGRNPDIVMFSSENMPVILAARGAAEDLTKYSKYKNIESRFSPSAMISFKYNNGVYGLPDIQMFYMTYYRKDIFDELKLKVPDTWDEFYSLSKKLQHSNLQIGISGGDQTILEMFLLQHNSNIYKSDLSGTCLTDKESLAAFTQWTQLYTHYGLDVAFDFLSRFRSGEMPIGIMPFTMFSSLSASAPEIRGLWAIAPIPGVLNDEGIVIRKQPCSVVGSIMLKNALNKNECFEFLDWWTQEDTQLRFGIETEALLGTSNRYFTANIKAFYDLPWSVDEAQAIQSQRNDVTDIYQTPASYYINRCVTNAFRNVVYYGKNPNEIITKYASQIDSELKKKRSEFGLN